MRPYYDAPHIRVPVQWYRANPDAEFMPPNAFSNIIDLAFPRFHPHVGIDYSFNPNSVGNSGGFLGIKPCGTPEALLNGVSFYNPAPDCECAREAMVMIQEVPSGTIDGTNRTFTTSKSPYANSYLTLYLDGVAQTQGVDYSLVGQTIYFAALSVPRAGDSLLCTYWVPT